MSRLTIAWLHWYLWIVTVRAVAIDHIVMDAQVCVVAD
jgi:hypothetical protein